jgi:glycosyltransferase involved in cell wall biosynthesis
MRYRHIATLTSRLTARVRELSPGARVHTVPLGFDLGQYRFAPREDHRATDHAPTVGLIGSFNWEPTLSAARRLLTRLWPEISRRVPTARLQLVGREAEHALESFTGTEGVTIVENVPDIMPHFDSTDVMLYAPARGSGMKVKVLEAFALGVPVVTNREGTEGLPVEDGVHADVTDDDAALVDRTVALLDDQQLRTRRAAAARSLVERHCDPTRVMDRLEAVYRSLEQGG